MDTNTADRLRREVRAAVFRTERLRACSRSIEADEQLAGELAAAHAALTTAGESDPAALLRRWSAEDAAAFALAQLVADLVAESMAAKPPSNDHPEWPLPQTPRALASPPAHGIGQEAFPPPSSTTPGIADLLDDMFAQERSRNGRPR